MSGCDTGISASWCVVHGDCTCQGYEDAPQCPSCLGTGEGPGAYPYRPTCYTCGGETVVDTVGPWSNLLHRYIDPSCPLHGEGSGHAL